MSIPAQQALVQWLAFFVCVVAGYALSGVIKLPDNPTVWVFLIAAVFILGYLPFLAFPVVIFNAPVAFNSLLWGLGVGFVVGFMVRRSQRERADQADADTRDRRGPGPGGNGNSDKGHKGRR